MLFLVLGDPNCFLEACLDSFKDQQALKKSPDQFGREKEVSPPLLQDNARQLRRLSHYLRVQSFQFLQLQRSRSLRFSSALSTFVRSSMSPSFSFPPSLAATVGFTRPPPRMPDRG